MVSGMGGSGIANKWMRGMVEDGMVVRVRDS
jgi:hypothetical protein